MIEIQNSKQSAFNLIRDLEFIWPNFKIRWCLYSVISDIYEFGIDSCPAGATFSRVVSEKA